MVLQEIFLGGVLPMSEPLPEDFMNVPVIFALSVALTLVSSFVQQPSTRQPVQLPELPKQNVPLAPVPMPSPQIAQQPVRRRSTVLQPNVVFANGALYIKVGDVFLPGPGSCCFCPDGVEKKPLTQFEVEQLSQSSGSKSNR
jgi:hypothetical protein